MPFLSKLTKRLALSAFGAAFTAVVVACGADAPNPLDSDTPAPYRASSTASISISPSSAAGTLGQSAQFTATVYDSRGRVINGKTITWTSSDSTVAAITTSGYATGVGVGHADLIASTDGVTAKAPVTVDGVAIASIALDPSSASGVVGESSQFTATLRDANGNVLTGRRVLWTSGAPSVVTIDSTGYATAVGPGTATIAATSGGVTGTASATVTGSGTVTAPGAVTDLAVSATTDSSLTLTFTQVGDGAGGAAHYDVRVVAGAMSWGSASAVSRGTCTSPLAGTTAGARMTCSVLGLSASQAYALQAVAYRGTLGVDAVFGALSNVASATTAAPPSSGPVVATVSVSPSSASGTVGQTAQFSATAYDASGIAITGQTATWSSTNAAVVTVTSAGFATATGCGSASLLATIGGKSGTSAITVTGCTSGGTATSGSVSPSSATIAVGSTQQLTAAVLDLLGNTLSGLVTSWSTSNAGVATVTSGGLVTGVAAGTATISANTAGVVSTAVVTVTSAPVAPTSTGWANAPASYPAITDQPFDILTSLNWYINFTGPSIAVDASAPQSAANVLQFTYPAGMAGGGGEGAIAKGLPNTRNVYAGFWVKTSADWQGHVSNVNKLAFMYTNSAGPMCIMFYGVPGGPYQLQVAMEFGTDSRFFLPANVATKYFTPGTWHKVEWLVNMGTAGAANGVVKFWLDGTLVGSYSDVTFPSVPLVEYQFAPTWGGIGDVKQHTDYLWYDHAILKGY